MSRVLITGGAGFIGSHIVDWAIREFEEVRVLDNMGYAARYENIGDHIKTRDVEFVMGDICNYTLYDKVLDGIDVVIHAAAESHVDNSFADPVRFINTNVAGTQLLMHACLQYDVEKIIHFSTDEVYGDSDKKLLTEEDKLTPTSPYAASKASGDLIVQSYIKAYNLPAVIIRPNNVYGIRQHPEKLIPTACMCIKQGFPIPLHGNGENKRTYLSVHDLVVNLEYLLFHYWTPGEIYNMGTSFEYSNNEIVKRICHSAGERFTDSISYVNDRQYNDKRYHIDCIKFNNLMSNDSEDMFNDIIDDIPELLDWYGKHAGEFVHGWYKNK